METPIISLDEAKIDAVFADLDCCHRPGVVVGIAVGGVPVYRKGFGLASMDLPVVLSPATRMPIGSMTKHFTCLAFMLLSEEGKIDLEDTIDKYFPDFHSTTRGVTIRSLMGHISGLYDAYDISMLFSGIRHEMSAAQVLSLYRDIDDWNASPGSRWVYNNGAYLIISAIIERVSQKSLEEVFTERIFQPLGMYDTLIRRFDTSFVSHSATLHAMGENHVFMKGFRPIEGVGQGGIVSTVDDMLRWLRHMNTPEIGTAATWKVMKSSMKLTNGMSTGYGLGLEISCYRGLETISHSGGVVGGNSFMLKIPMANLDIVVMANRYDVSSGHLTRKILDECLPGPSCATEPYFRRPCCGIFFSAAAERLIQLIADGDRQVVSIDGTDIPFTWQDERTLVPPSGLAQPSVRLIGDPNCPESIRFTDYGGTIELPRAVPSESAEDFEIEGKYRSLSTGTHVTVFDAGRCLRTTGRFGAANYALRPITRGVWKATAAGPLPMSALLILSGDGKTLRISTSRTHALVFERERS